eukprot:CAMPEP_0202922706 /NCGR_PEP_ID=MMETSP1392-20130828/78063_1 /ASSEMBLY_ACC=CAM_ASM_000868 /TAXON_ID=225041 /ORGANISM="Chlamydomonas chlamydogama, Strain SAG 11-48b" /LENGTH=121 /DNA_ID=CAMNT_0049616347 /DNA_START=126 /DNA_END=494 /DNA_ORIENTATION=-
MDVSLLDKRVALVLLQIYDNDIHWTVDAGLALGHASILEKQALISADLTEARRMVDRAIAERRQDIMEARMRIAKAVHEGAQARSAAKAPVNHGVQRAVRDCFSSLVSLFNWDAPVKLKTQ